MKTTTSMRARVATGRRVGADRHIGMLLLAATLCAAQPASITYTALPDLAKAVFGPSGTTYLWGNSGPVTAGAYQAQHGQDLCPVPFGFAAPCPDVHVIKADASGQLVWGATLGGVGLDAARAVAADVAGNVYVAGTTENGFAMTPGAARENDPQPKSFLAKLSADGAHLLYATYLPDGLELPNALVVDSLGNAYVAGRSPDQHAIVIKVNASGSAFLYETPIETGEARALAADPHGVVVVGNAATDAFVAMLGPNGEVARFIRVGGSGPDSATDVKLDPAGNIYVAGTTESVDLPAYVGTQPPFVPLWSRGPGGFVLKMNPQGQVAWSNFVPSGSIYLAVGAAGDTYVTSRSGVGFPVTASAPQPCLVNGVEFTGVVAHLDPNGLLKDATYLGENPMAIAIQDDGTVEVAWQVTVPGVAIRTVRGQVRFGGAGWNPSPCLSSPAVHAATWNGAGLIAPGAFITLTGWGIGPETGVGYQRDTDGKIPRSLAGVQVVIDGLPAPVLYAQAQQVNALVPVELSKGTDEKVEIRLVYDGVTIGSTEAVVVPVFGGLFRLQPNASAQALAVNQDNTFNGPENPIARGDVVQLWGSGFGPTIPACETGGLNYPGAAGLAPGYGVDFLAYGVDTSGGNGPFGVEYSGSAPTLPCGVEQLNFRIPLDAPVGEYWIQPRAKKPAGGISSSGQARIWVK